MGRDLHPLSLHFVMFIPTLQGQTTDEQLDEWLSLAIARGIIGTYAQTELGHGTNLKNLETTATYDPKTKEFIINSPTITSAKWWPGALGKSSNYAVVVAQLYTQGVCRGPHPFIVQLRDLETHKPLKGVRVGDIGPKFGFNSSDNGFLLFDNYRIPRNHMLMRHSKVEEDGTFIAPKHSKLNYGTMVFVRSIMIKDQATQLAAATCIAIRYSAIRRQGEISQGCGEVQILDYQTQQFRLLPQLARAFAFMFAAYEIRDLYMKVTEQLTQGNTELLPEIHALSSGLKSVVSWEAAQGIEQCRLACGGHGYSLASAFPEIYAYSVGGCTYEGENIVMLLQVARFLMKAAEEVRSGSAHLAAICGYIGKPESVRSRFTTWDSYSDADIVHDFEHVAKKQVFRAYNALKRHQRESTPEEGWNRASIELCKASRMHVRLYLVKTFLQKIATTSEPSLRAPLTDLATLYVFDLITASQGEFTKGGFMSDIQADAVREGIYRCLERLRPNAVSLVDSWDFDDAELHSVLGRRDGNVYPALLEWAQKSQLNRTEVLPTFEKYLGPMMKDGRSKL
ncbi:acyl-CoA dehydrogenase, middle domain protein [Necator americanus]|uniref:Acyl-coenzyme A oxidase n=1 Tax=Necator americanus TaxID=51031 RepID=W2T0V3_NECAM|nr:acyl-CoA dehydrogenase, middle domain protein [Necator americanus]ETN75635.1 acyl-CoA dehydrogenase, middle domain protein [Necator americanus]